MEFHESYCIMLARTFTLLKKAKSIAYAIIAETFNLICLDAFIKSAHAFTRFTSGNLLEKL